MALVVYVALRAAILLTAFDAVSIPAFELCTIGNLAKVIVEGRGGAPHALHFDNVGGHLVVGWLAAPLYWLLGDRYFVLKLVPLLLGIGTLLLIWRLLRRHFDDRAAVIAVFLFALAPPTLCKYSLIAQGNHFENLFFQLLFLNAFFDVHAAPVTKRALLLLGLFAGLALFFYIGALLLIATAALVHVVLRGVGRSLRDLAYVGPACLVGMAPLLWLDLSTGGRERYFLERRFFESHSEAGLLDKASTFFGDVLPRSPCFEPIGPVGGETVGWIFLACFAVAWLSAVRRARATHWPLILHLPAFALVVVLFDFSFTPYGPPIEVGRYRYLVPHLAFATIVIAIVCGRGLASPRKSARFCAGALAAIALSTGAFTLPIVKLDRARIGDGARYDGYWYEGYANVLVNDPPWDHGEVEARLIDFDPLFRRRAIAGVAFYAAWRDDIGRGNTPTSALDVAGIVGDFSPELSIDAAHGCGTYLRRLILEERGGPRLTGILDALDREHPELSPFCAEGLALDVRYPLATSAPELMQRGLALRAHVPARLRPSLHRGLGIACGRLLPRGLDDALVHATRRELGEQFGEEFDFGLGWGIAESTHRARRCVSLRTADAIRDRDAAWRGFGAASRHNEGAGFDFGELGVDAHERASLVRGAHWPEYPRPKESP